MKSRSRPPKKDTAPPSTPEDGATFEAMFGELMLRFEAAAEPMRVMLAPELAAWLDSWQVSYEGQPHPEGLDEYRDCTISEKLHFLILSEKLACERAHRQRVERRGMLTP